MRAKLRLASITGPPPATTRPPRRSHSGSSASASEARVRFGRVLALPNPAALDGGFGAFGALNPAMQNCDDHTFAIENERFDPREFDDPADPADRVLFEFADGVGDGGRMTVVSSSPSESNAVLGVAVAAAVAASGAVPACAKIRPMAGRGFALDPYALTKNGKVGGLCRFASDP